MRLVNKPDAFHGRDGDWPSSALLARAYTGAADPISMEPIRLAGDPEISIDLVGTGPANESFVWDGRPVTQLEHGGTG